MSWNIMASTSACVVWDDGRALADGPTGARTMTATTRAARSVNGFGRGIMILRQKVDAVSH
jgi:hypothetical protein